jgi:hypothetical protein
MAWILSSPTADSTWTRARASIRPRRRRWASIGLGLLALAASASAQSAVFDHVATAATISGSRTYVSHPLLDGRPNAVFFVTHHWNPPGQTPRYNDHSVGVVYVGLAGSRWAITNRDNAPMVEGTTFTLWVPREGTVGSFSYRHTTAAGDVLGNLTRLDHPSLNGHPELYLSVTPVFEDAEPDAEFGVWYEAGAGRWTIFRQDNLATMPTGLAFNVCVGQCGIEALAAVVDLTCPENPTGSNVCTVLSSPSFTREYRLLLAGSWDGVYLDDPTGVYWSSSPAGWGIFLEDTAADMPEGARFIVKSTALVYRNGFESGDFFGWTLP